MRMHNSTIRRNKKPCKTCGVPSYIFSHGDCQPCSIKKSVLSKDEEENDEIERESFNNLVEDLDAVFSQIVRMKGMDKDGYNWCYTSGTKLPWQQLQCGHFISRRHYATRWLEDNARPQSEHDNCFLHGNLQMFEERLEEEKPGIVQHLRELSREVYKPTIDDLKQLLSQLRYRLSVIKKKV